MDDLYLASTFEHFYRSEFPGLVGVATALVGDVRDAEDLVQDTMVKVFLGWRKVSVLDRPGAWCHRVLTHACWSRLRRRKIERNYLARHVTTHLEHRSNGPTGDNVVFWTIVRTLPTRPRAIVALYFAGERTTAEIATILGVPEGTVTSDITRARRVIMKAMQ